MPTVAQLASWAQEQVRAGKGDKHTNHVVIVEEEQAKREKNEPDEEGKRKTRIVWDAQDADTFAAFHAERERWMKAAGSNPTLATDMLIVALKAYSEEGMKEIRDTLNEIHASQCAGEGPPKAEIPSFSKASWE